MNDKHPVGSCGGTLKDRFGCDCIVGNGPNQQADPNGFPPTGIQLPEGSVPFCGLKNGDPKIEYGTFIRIEATNDDGGEKTVLIGPYPSEAVADLFIDSMDVDMWVGSGGYLDDDGFTCDDVYVDTCPTEDHELGIPDGQGALASLISELDVNDVIELNVGQTTLKIRNEFVPRETDGGGEIRSGAFVVSIDSEENTAEGTSRFIYDNADADQGEAAAAARAAQIAMHYLPNRNAIPVDDWHQHDSDERYPGHFTSYVKDVDGFRCRLVPGNNDTYAAPGFSWTATDGEVGSRHGSSGWAPTPEEAAAQARDYVLYVNSGQAEMDYLLRQAALGQ